MKSWYVWASLVLIAMIVTACGGAHATDVEEAAVIHYESDALDTSFEGALDVSGQLALGTLRLEEAEHAVTEEQAKTLLPLWQALQGGGVTAEDEINAVLRGIEGAMTEEQLAAIAEMALTEEDMQAWMEEQGIGAGGGFPGAGGDPDTRATRRAEGGGGMPPGGEIPSGEDVPPAMATRTAEFQSMSEEEREAMRATAEAAGGVGAGFRGGVGDGPGAFEGGVGQVRSLLRPLIEMLTERAG